MAPPVPSAVDESATEAPAVGAATDTALSSYDDLAVQLYRLQRALITEVCPDLDLREARLQRARVALFFQLLGPNMIGALRLAGMLSTSSQAPAPSRTDRPGTVLLSDEDRAARHYVVQRERILAIWTDAAQREARLLRVHDRLLQNLGVAARQRYRDEKHDNIQG